jgi:large subunit ribosomal protein L11
MPPKKEVMAKIKLQCPGGQATPAPPVGPALGQHGVNIGEFVKRFNDATKKEAGLVTPCIVTVYKDRTFDIVYKTPPASVLLKKYANVVKGSGTPNKEKVGTVTRKHLEEIAKVKIKDMNASSMEAAIRAIEGTARNMGIKVEG